MSLDRHGLAAAVAAHGAVARVVVAAVAGSAPREAGAAMLVWAGGQSGTIGGGALEWQAAAAAREMLAGGRRPVVSRHPLGPALGQCCGGAVTLVSEVWDADAVAALPGDGAVLRRIDGPEAAPLALRRAVRAVRGEGAAVTGPILRDGWLLEAVARPVREIWIWGAGHVGRAIVGVLAPLPELRLTWIDTGAERFPDTVPEGVSCLPVAAPVALVRRAPVTAEHLVLTYSHALDLELCHALLTHGFGFAGLIGSATKRARFRSRLIALGHAPEALARIVCPIGDPALGKAPQAIAIGVAAALLRATPAEMRQPEERRA